MHLWANIKSGPNFLPTNYFNSAHFQYLTHFQNFHSRTTSDPNNIATLTHEAIRSQQKAMMQPSYVGPKNEGCSTSDIAQVMMLISGVESN
jgi:hypothetical protein